MLGRMDHRIALREPTMTRGSDGSPSRSFTNARFVWAEVLDIKSDEPVGTDGQRTILTKRFRIRYQKDLAIDTTWQIVWNSKTYHIHSILDKSSQRNVYIEIEATEQVNT